MPTAADTHIIYIAMKKLMTLWIALVALTGFFQSASAQCSSPNNAFKSGETLMYDLYFNWKFVWVKVGSASMNITSSVYQGKPGFRAHLITRGSKQADKFFVMRDTLQCYTTRDLVPLYYKKCALEGKSYRRDEVWYSYAPGKVTTKMRHQRNDLAPEFNTYSSKYCAYDMLSMLLRARSFDPSDYKVGHRITFLMADGRKSEWQSIIYRGKENFTVENTGTTYRCLVFSFVEKEDGEEKEVVTFYVTDDDNHIPVRLDMYLNFGSAKAFLIGARGLRNPQKAKLK